MRKRNSGDGTEWSENITTSGTGCRVCSLRGIGIHTPREDVSNVCAHVLLITPAQQCRSRSSISRGSCPCGTQELNLGRHSPATGLDATDTTAAATGRHPDRPSHNRLPPHHRPHTRHGHLPPHRARWRKLVRGLARRSALFGRARRDPGRASPGVRTRPSRRCRDSTACTASGGGTRLRYVSGATRARCSRGCSWSGCWMGCWGLWRGANRGGCIRRISRLMWSSRGPWPRGCCGIRRVRLLGRWGGETEVGRSDEIGVDASVRGIGGCGLLQRGTHCRGAIDERARWMDDKRWRLRMRIADTCHSVCN